MSLDKNAVARIATLARIKVPDADREEIATELTKLFDWIAALGEVDTNGVAPMASATQFTLPRRTDTITDGDRQEEILENAPAAMLGFFTVPKVVE